MENATAKQAIVEQIKKSTNILVTVSHDPSVDSLAAALGFTLMLNKLDKRATAVFSGSVPPAIKFLEPEKTFEGNTDSLQDFIIALDKEKADRLRYKVEDDVVRIFITPYKTQISQKDLQFSRGDFNVELIIALGVDQQADLDKAIQSHGKILHDATVVTVNVDNKKSSLGSVQWSDDKASSLCEMLMGLSEALQPNLADEQIATALLTGIVAATDRFSNTLTSPRVMTMSAQLMAAGANQQLIAERLSEGAEQYEPSATSPTPNKQKTKKAPDGSQSLEEGKSTRLPKNSDKPSDVIEQSTSGDDSTKIEHVPPANKVSHLSDAGTDEAASYADTLAQAAEDGLEKTGDLKPEIPEEPSQEQMVVDEASAETPEANVVSPQLRDDLEAATDELNQTTNDWRSTGTAPATNEPLEQSQNNQDVANLPPLPPIKPPTVETHRSEIVGHESPADRPGTQSINNSGNKDEPNSVDMFGYEMTGPKAPEMAQLPVEPSAESEQQVPAETQPQTEVVTPADQTQALLDTAMAAADQASMSTSEASEAPSDAQPPSTDNQVQATQDNQSNLPPLPPIPPMPDFSQLPQLPPELQNSISSPANNATASTVPPSERGVNNTHVIGSDHVNLNVPPSDRAQGFGNPNSPYTSPPGSTLAANQFRIPGQ